LAHCPVSRRALMQAPMWALNSPSSDAEPRAAARRACAGQSPYVAQSRAPPADSRLPNMCRLRKQSARAPPSTTQVQVFARFPPCLVASRMVSLTRPKHSKAADSLAQRRELAQRRLTLRLKRRNFQHGKARRLVHTPTTASLLRKTWRFAVTKYPPDTVHPYRFSRNDVCHALRHPVARSSERRLLCVVSLPSHKHSRWQATIPTSRAK